jgi:hypothetical protein
MSRDAAISVGRGSELAGLSRRRYHSAAHPFIVIPFTSVASENWTALGTMRVPAGSAKLASESSRIRRGIGTSVHAANWRIGRAAVRRINPKES